MTAKLIEALCKAQLEITPPRRDKKGNFNNSYASIDSVCESIRMTLSKHGLGLLQHIETTEGRNYLRTDLYHSSGEQLSTKMPLPVEASNPKAKDFGAALTYMKRYAICSLLCLSTDDDLEETMGKDEPVRPQTGNRSNHTLDKNSKGVLPMTMSPSQIEEIDTLIAGDTELLGRMLAGYRKQIPTIQTIADIPADNYPAIINTLTKRKT
jgi:hypothetical protein